MDGVRTEAVGKEGTVRTKTARPLMCTQPTCLRRSVTLQTIWNANAVDVMRSVVNFGIHVTCSPLPEGLRPIYPQGTSVVIARSRSVLLDRGTLLHHSEESAVMPIRLNCGCLACV